MQTVKIAYSDFKMLEAEFFPFIADLAIQAGEKKLTAKLTYSNIVKNGTFETPFVVPESYKTVIK